MRIGLHSSVERHDLDTFSLSDLCNFVAILQCVEILRVGPRMNAWGFIFYVRIILEWTVKWLFFVDSCNSRKADSDIVLCEERRVKFSH